MAHTLEIMLKGHYIIFIYLDNFPTNIEIQESKEVHTYHKYTSVKEKPLICKIKNDCIKSGQCLYFKDHLKFHLIRDFFNHLSHYLYV